MIERKTIFSPCRRYRYTLWREWGDIRANLLPDPHFDYYPGRPDEYLQVIGLNPSVADEKIDDPTVRRCINFAKTWGFGALCMTNAFAWRDTDPAKMKAASRPIGEFVVGGELAELNDRWLLAISRGAGLIIAAWGKHGDYRGRNLRILELIPKLHCLGKNIDGSPKHPLYVRADTQPIPYP